MVNVACTSLRCGCCCSILLAFHAVFPDIELIVRKCSLWPQKGWNTTRLSRQALEISPRAPWARCRSFDGIGELVDKFVVMSDAFYSPHLGLALLSWGCSQFGSTDPSTFWSGEWWQPNQRSWVKLGDMARENLDIRAIASCFQKTDGRFACR